MEGEGYQSSNRLDMFHVAVGIICYLMVEHIATSFNSHGSRLHRSSVK